MVPCATKCEDLAQRARDDHYQFQGSLDIHDDHEQSRLTNVSPCVQVSMEQVRVEAQFDGLSPNSSHQWSVNTYGDLTSGADSTGPVYDSSAAPANGEEVSGG